MKNLGLNKLFMSVEILSIIQARTGSSRLPKKVLFEIEGIPVIRHVYNRVSSSKLIDSTFVATTDLLEDDGLVFFCEANEIPVFRGSSSNVLDRFYQLAKLINPKYIVRITSDCPVIDPQVIDHIIEEHLKGNFDYTSNTLEIPYPDGQDVEIFNFSSLENAWRNARLASDLEHVTPYIKLNENKFRINKVLSKKSYSKYRWTLDEKEDFELMKEFYKELYRENPLFGMKELLKLNFEKPHLQKINSMHHREEGYKKSLENDYLVK